ncbi:hypothetical protein, partial [Mesorhizobium sp. M7A.F.Ca.ET.027.03.2.1]
MKVRGAGEIAKLTGPEPEEVFEAIRGRILQDDNFAAKLKGTDGLVRLVEARRSCSIRHLHLGRRTSVRPVWPGKGDGEEQDTENSSVEDEVARYAAASRSQFGHSYSRNRLPETGAKDRTATSLPFTFFEHRAISALHSSRLLRI